MPSAVPGGQIVRTSARRSARQLARFAGALYLAIIATSIYSFYRPETRLAFDLRVIALAAFVIVVAVLYVLFKPVSRNLSLAGAIFGVAGSTMGVLNSFHLAPFRLNNLVLFAFYCILIGTLIIRSSFIPRHVGVLMVIAGPGYLTLLWPAFGNSLEPWNLIPGAVGELTLAVWLFVKGVNQERWVEQSWVEQSRIAAAE